MTPGTPVMASPAGEWPSSQSNNRQSPSGLPWHFVSRSDGNTRNSQFCSHWLRKSPATKYPLPDAAQTHAARLWQRVCLHLPKFRCAHQRAAILDYALQLPSPSFGNQQFTARVSPRFQREQRYEKLQLGRGSNLSHEATRQNLDRHCPWPVLSLPKEPRDDCWGVPFFL